VLKLKVLWIAPSSSGRLSRKEFYPQCMASANIERVCGASGRFMSGRSNSGGKTAGSTVAGLATWRAGRRTPSYWPAGNWRAFWLHNGREQKLSGFQGSWTMLNTLSLRSATGAIYPYADGAQRSDFH
jgi:hypothetical protein